VRFREGEAAKALLDVLFYVAGDLLVALLSPLLGYRGGQIEGGAPLWRSEDPS
jgi:hypothetical protein